MLIGHENKTDTKDDIMVKKTIAAFFTVLVLSSALTACNTTRGEPSNSCLLMRKRSVTMPNGCWIRLSAS